MQTDPPIKPSRITFKALDSSPPLSTPSPTYQHHMAPKMARNPARNSNDRKTSNLLPDLEDVGKLLNNCSPGQGRKSNQGQSSDGNDCLTCARKDTCETAVHASSKLAEHESPVSEEGMLHTKYQASLAKAVHQATEGSSIKAAENAARRSNSDAAQQTGH